MSDGFQKTYDIVVGPPVEAFASYEARVAAAYASQGFSKLHEACGSSVAGALLDGVPPAVADKVRALTSQKRLASGDFLRPLKLLVDSEIDADRIDATARDGLLAGREYGTFDGDRIATSVRLRKTASEWGLAYSDKALSSMEALLLDRYRTHTWIHFHHRVVAMKVAATEVVGQMLMDSVITKDDFQVGSESMPLRDDTWLWSKIREWEPSSDAARAAKRALLFRDNSQVTLLWKNRADYEQVQNTLRDASGKREIGSSELGRKYEQELEKRLGVKAVCFWLSFKPVGADVVPVVSEAGEPRRDLLGLSPLAGMLSQVWRGEPQYFVVLLGKYSGSFQEIRQRWIDETVRWLNG